MMNRQRSWNVLLLIIGGAVVIIFEHSADILIEGIKKFKDPVPTIQRSSIKPKTPTNAVNIPVVIMDEMLRLNEEKVAHDDPRLIKLIRENFIHQPSTEPYNLANPNKTDYAGQGKDFVVPNTLKDLPDKGFFIECGAHNGEFLSSTLYFEKTKQWSGLLIEANQQLFKQLLLRHRKAYAINACLSTKTYPSVMTFNELHYIGRLVKGTVREAYQNHKNFKVVSKLVQLQCFPLYSLLLALDQTHVDFMGLDVEGTELDILRTVPWDKVHITNILAEFSHDEGGMEAMKKFFEMNGYKTIKTLKEDLLVQRK